MNVTLSAIDWNLLLGPPTIFGLGGIVLAIVAVVAPQWRRVQQTTILAKLTRDMLDRGFTAEQIERILEAGARMDGRHSDSMRSQHPGRSADHGICSE